MRPTQTGIPAEVRLTTTPEEIAALMTAMRQLGVGFHGGAEALAIFHQLIYNDWASGSLNEPLARIKVDEKNCFGQIEWKAVRKACCIGGMEASEPVSR